MVPPLKIYILYCFDEKRDSLPKLNNFYEKVDLRDYWKITGHPHNADGDFFKSEIDLSSDHIGVVTASYSQKWYKSRVDTPIEKLFQLPMDNNIVWAPNLWDSWYQHSVENHPGMEVYLEEMTKEYPGVDLIKPGIYNQNFICSKYVFKDWQNFWKYWFKRWDKQEPLKYRHYEQHISCWSGALMERVTAFYFAMKNDLIIKQIP